MDKTKKIGIYGMRQMLTHAFTPEEISLVEKVNDKSKTKRLLLLNHLDFLTCFGVNV
jgi:hypothetical protein